MSENVDSRPVAGPKHGAPPRVCLVATLPGTLTAFYRPLVNALLDSGCMVTLVASPGTELDEFQPSARLQTQRVPIRRAISPLRDIRSIITLVRLLRSYAFDLVHTHTPKAGLLGMIAATIARVPRRIHTLHGLPLETAHGLRRCLLIMADRVTCALAHRVCVVSTSLRQRALDLNLCNPGKMVLLANGSACGVDLDRFRRTDQVVEQAERVRRENRIPPDAPVVGFVGWLVADKGVTELVDVFTALAEQRENLHLLMIGPRSSERDPLPARTLNTIRDHPRIHHAGLTGDPAPYYAAMDMCVLPTRREGFPYALLEAAAMEVPVVATKVTGCVDAVVDGKTGLLVEPNDSPSLAAAIESLIDDAALRGTLGAAARRRVEASFGSDRLARAHLLLYRELGLWC